MFYNLPNQLPPGPHELWPLNCPKTELAVSALQVLRFYIWCHNHWIYHKYDGRILCQFGPHVTNMSFKIYKSSLHTVLQNEFSTCLSENTTRKSMQTRKLVKRVMLQKILCYKVLSYSNPNRRDRSPQCIALRYQVFAMIDIQQ